jgi:hypothetical protein
MELNDATRVLAYSFVSELIRKRRSQKVGELEESDLGYSYAKDIADVNFGELENYYNNVLSVIEKTPEIRESIVNTLNRLKEEGKDLNELYPSQLIASEPSLKSILFMNDNPS